ncbi:MAG TPA: hypothetical protein VE621_09435, partial [Bryobacteraceae bacterium]|nr:hypothetical protein [Bryobacteraceae bacterium]
MKFGNELMERTDFNTRMQPVTIELGLAKLPNLAWKASYLYCFPDAQSCATNNGNVRKHTIDNLGIVQSFSYDTKNRLQVANETYNGGTAWSQTYNYDNFGNRWITGTAVDDVFTPTSQNFCNNRWAHQNMPGCLAGSNNQYDSAGNQTGVGGTFTYSY